ncbi:MAG: Glycosyl transferase, family 9 [Candidatus Azambacteria bacterium GW2011_GWB1_42_17]|uniref:Glycosyl transferase, family 9 n=1 Tax=Candidatus Azambacteria bacterium GW2011_GWB1_42_17 TaxID=1618615 RepID=A0A0G0Z869_9BACT|nr:MAG: Glycosyl transferase, family 9 [Candidatus Azambacteria bacterium GW2011_GWB1_42_17]
MSRNKGIIVLIFFIAILSGIFWNQKIFGQPISSDQLGYDGIAMDILSSGRFTSQGQSTFREPGYPLFLAAVYKIFGHNFDTVRYIQIIIFGLLVVIIYLLAENIFGRNVAIFSSLSVAFFYGLANQSGLITTELLFAFLLSLFAYSIYKASAEDGNNWLVFSALVLGGATLVRGVAEFLFFLVIVNLFIIYKNKISYKKIFYKIAIFTICFFMVLTPWLVKNKFKNGISVSSFTGYYLLLQTERIKELYPHYSGHFIGYFLGYYVSERLNFDTGPGDNKYFSYFESPIQSRIAQLIAAGYDYGDISNVFTKEALPQIVKHPVQFLSVSALNFFSFNGPILIRGPLWQNGADLSPQFADGRHPEIPDYLKLIIILTPRLLWFLFFFFTIKSIVKNLCDWEKVGWLVLIIIYFNIIYSASSGLNRYALPIYPFYMIFAVAGMQDFLSRRIVVKLKNASILALAVAKFVFKGRADKKIIPKKILIVQEARMGDMVCTTPMFRAVKEKYSEIRLYVMGNEINRELLSSNPDVDVYLIYPKNLYGLFKIIKKEKFDFACITAPNFTALAALYLADIPLIAAPVIENGFSPYETRPYKISRSFVTTRPHRMGNYAAREYLRLLEPIGIFSKDTEKYLYFSEMAMKFAEAFLAKNGINFDSDFIVGITPSAGSKIKEWPCDRFAKLADYIYSKYQAKIIIIGGPGDVEVDEMISFLAENTKFVNAKGLFDIEELKALVSKLHLFISVDTGPIYIAEAFNVPTIDIIGPMDENEQPPMGKFHKIVVAQRLKPALHIMNARVYDAKEVRRQAESITVEMVIKELDNLMDKISIS